VQDLASFDGRHWVRSRIAGGSFAEVGRLWNCQGELVTTAVEEGAHTATKLDHAPMGHGLWQEFRSHVEQRLQDASRVRIKSADILNSYFPAQVGSFDIVACPGLLHLMPEPGRALLNLRAVTQRAAFLSSMVVPEVIENTAGRIDLRDAGALYAPTLGERQKAILAEHFAGLGIDFATLVPSESSAWVKAGNFSRSWWWWFMTPRHVEALATMAGFAISARATDWPGRSYCVELAA
jgi:hypothetical protein